MTIKLYHNPQKIPAIKETAKHNQRIAMITFAFVYLLYIEKVQRKGRTLDPNASLIKGTICGYKIEEIENPLTKKVRYLDKLIDELAQGKKMEKILRG